MKNKRVKRNYDNEPTFARRYLGVEDNIPSITFEVDDHTLEEGDVYRLVGAHVKLVWCVDEDTAALFATDNEEALELTAPMLRELAALTQHPQFAVALATIEKAEQ